MTKKKMVDLLKKIEERQMKEEKVFWAGGSGGKEEEEEEEEGFQFMISTEEPCLPARPIHMPEYPE